MEIFDVPAREGFDPNFLRLRKRGFWSRLLMSTLLTWINNHADVVVVGVDE